MCSCHCSAGAWHCTQLNFVASSGPSLAFSGAVRCSDGAILSDEKYSPRSFMSALERFAAIGDICGSLRLPSRNWNSCVVVAWAGWPASDGMSGFVELPSGPWHAAHTCALARPVSTSAVAVLAQTKSPAAKPTAVPRTETHHILRRDRSL